MTDTEEVSMSHDTIKHKTIFFTRYLEHKFRDCSSLAMQDGKKTMYLEFL